MLVTPKLLLQDFNSYFPIQKWVYDITYLRTSDGLLYLTVVINLFSVIVADGTISARITAGLICQALIMGLRRGKTPQVVIAHSNRVWSQYCSAKY